MTASVEQRREYQKAYVRNNPDKVKESARKYREKNREKIAAQKRESRKGKTAELAEKKKKWVKNNPDIVSMQRARARIARQHQQLGSSLKHHYGVHVDAYKTISELQNGVCLICGCKTESKRAKRLFIDHDHKTGVLRGLLCGRCNCGLGYFKDNVDNLLMAIKYLEAFDEFGKESDWESRVRLVLESVSKEDGEGARAVDVEEVKL